MGAGRVIREIGNALCAIGILIGGGLSALGLLLYFAGRSAPEGSLDMSGAVGIVAIVVGGPILAVSIVGLLL
jgi:hypothetical protein